MCEKKGILWKKLGRFAVAPYAGAWIEISAAAPYAQAVVVAPYAGAWIEIGNVGTEGRDVRSLPTRERGLKLTMNTGCRRWGRVAPYAGAWIEIYNNYDVYDGSISSLPTRERGLKFQWQHTYLWQARSLPTRERGLK